VEAFQTVILKMEELIVLALSEEVIHTVSLKVSCVVMTDVMTYYKDVKSTIICLFVSADIWKSCNLVMHIHQYQVKMAMKSVKMTLNARNDFL